MNASLLALPHCAPHEDTPEPAVGAPIAMLGVPFDNVTRGHTLALVERMIASRQPHYIATANVDFLVQAQEDVELRRILFDAHLVLCDGTPLVWASRLLGNPLPERVAGSDIVPLLLESAERHGHRIFILGAQEDIAERAVANIRAKHPRIIVAGRLSPRHAALHEMDHDAICSAIRAAQPDILLVAMGCPKQEKWISMHYRGLGVPVSVGIGATVDFLAGAVKRAPRWMQRCGLEWTWRLAQEPRRLARRYAKDLWVFGRAMFRQWLRLSPRKPAAGESDTVPPARTVSGNVLVMPERLDAAAVQEHREAWEAGLQQGSLVVDLSATTFADSTGIGFLMRLRRGARERHAPFALAGTRPAVARTIALMKLTDFFPAGATVDAAAQAAEQAMDDKLRVFATGHGVALQLHGELTAANVAESIQHIEKLIAEAKPGENFELDLAHLEFVDSAGIAGLMRLRKASHRAQAGFSVKNLKPAVMSVLRMTRLADLLLNAAACKSD